MADLAEFTLEVSCPKCGCDTDITKLFSHVAGVESILLECKDCTYRWRMKTRDAKAND